MFLFGPHVPDVTPPTFELVYPPEGASFVLPTTFVLRGEIEDELHPQFYDIEVFSNGMPVGDPRMDVGLEGDLELVITDPEPGDYNLRIILTDEGGNVSEDEVSFTILPEGSALPDDEATDEGLGDGSGCRVGVAGHNRPGTTWGLMLLLWAVGRRRRG